MAKPSRYDAARCVACGRGLPELHGADGACLACRNVCQRKKAYADRFAAEDALDHLRRTESVSDALEVYACPLAPHFHLGHSAGRTARPVRWTRRR